MFVRLEQGSVMSKLLKYAKVIYTATDDIRPIIHTGMIV